MSTSESGNVRLRAMPPALTPRGVQLVHANDRIRLLESVLEDVRQDLEDRADIGTVDGDHTVQLSQSIYSRLCDVTNKYGRFKAIAEGGPPLTWWEKVKQWLRR